MFAVVSSVVVAFAPVRSGGRIANGGGWERTAPRFVAMSPLDNWTDEEEEDEGDYDIESLSSGGLVSSPGVVVSVSILLYN